MTTAESTFRTLSKHAESIRNDGEHDLSGMEIGDEWRQGDVAIVRLDPQLVRQLELEPTPAVAQLAPGNTQGSRHTLDSLEGVKMFRLADASVLDGPVMEFSESRSILHPEHGDLMHLPPGFYGVQYQRAYAAELRAVQD